MVSKHKPEQIWPYKDTHKPVEEFSAGKTPSLSTVVNHKTLCLIM